MTVTFIEWKPERILDKVADTLEQAGPVYAQATILQMSNPVWNWNWDTRRRVSLLMGGERQQGQRGVVVRAGRRDIVDTGRLLDSMTAPKVVREQGAITLQIEWKAPYSGRVLAGGDYGTYTPPGQRDAVSMPNRPARNWIEAAFQSQPPLDVFSNIWRGGS
jgi:hypothetical protein